MLKSKKIAAINIDKEQWKLVIGSLNLETNQINLEFFGVYSDIGKLKGDLASHSLTSIGYSISSQYCKSYTTQPLNELNFVAEKAARHITENDAADYFLFSNSAILASLPKTNLLDIAQFQPVLDLKCNYAITHSDILLAYSVMRNYSDRQRNSIAILNFEQSHIGLTILQNGSVKQTLWMAIKTDQDLTPQLITLLKSGARFCEQPAKYSAESPAFIATYDLVLGVGETTLELLIELKAMVLKQKINIREVELLDSLRGNLISTQNLAVSQQLEIETASYRYAVPTASILMYAEKLGIDLTKNNKLDKKLTSQFELKSDENLITRAIGVAVGSAKTIIPSVVSQKYLVLAIVILSIVLTGYRYNTYNNQLVELENAYSAEKAKENDLIGVKIDYELAQKRNKLKNERTLAIKNIQKTQLLVSTILSDLQTLPYQSRFKDLVTISSMEIAGSNIHITGQALDKTGAVALVNTVQQNPAYEDVTPSYKSLDAVRCGYELTTKFIGSLPSNQTSLPRVTPLQVATNNNINNQ